MPIEVQWENPEKSVVRFVHSGKWTWEEYQTTNRAVLQEIEGFRHPISIIVDTGEGYYMPPNALSNLRQNPLMRHQGVRRIYIIVRNRFIQTMAMMVTKLVDFGPNPPKFVTSKEQAYADIDAGKVAKSA